MDEGRVEVILLGTGTSHGVPMIGCRCAVCTSSDPRDKRTRPSIFVRWAGQSFLVDTSPELRLQCLAAGVDHVDSVLFTHHHADHVFGLDDLRRFNYLRKGPLHCYASPDTLDALHGMFAYAFAPPSVGVTSRPHLTWEVIGHEPFRVGEAVVTPIPVMHGDMPVLGFRFGRFAYCTDCNRIPEESMKLLAGLDVLVLDALRHRPHPTHFNVEQAVAAAKMIGAKQTYFTHIAHDLKHVETCAELPTGMALGFDGQRIVA